MKTYYWVIIIIIIHTAPPAAVEITQDHEGSNYVGTPLKITCLFLLVNFTDIPQIITVHWEKEGAEIIDTERVTQDITMINELNYTTALAFYPLNVSDTGVYQCSMNIESDQFINNITINASVSIIVNG